MMYDVDASFTFIDDLHIEGSSFSLESEESLVSSLIDVDDKIQDIGNEIVALQRRISELEQRKSSIQGRLERISSSRVEIRLGESSLSMQASPSEKANFLFELFHGRRDVYAERNWNEKTSKASYYPVCLNAWTANCLLKKFKDKESVGSRPSCSDCQCRLYESLSPEIICSRNMYNYNDHGKGAVGIYAMLPGNVCRFVAIDLDESTWRKDALELASVARKSGFQMAIEQSFSGKGAHLWLFFSEDVPAFKARRLAFSFLDEACENSRTVSLKSYDRVFPTQDEIEEGCFGNLILMPLMAGAARRKEGKGTVFVDNDFNVYPDQISFLSSVPRYSEDDIDLYLVTHRGSDNGLDFFNDGSELEKDVIWKKRLPKVTKKDCLPKALPVFLSSGLSIPKSAMTARLQNGCKRLACFMNPNYFKSRKRNKGYVSDKLNSFVESFLESDEVLQLPRGLKDELERYLKASGIDYELKDLRAHNTGLDVNFNGTLKEVQIQAVDSMKAVEIGILNAATSFGKTVVAAKLIAERKEKTLVLVQKQKLMDQWKASLEKFLVVGNAPLKRTGKRTNKTGIGVYGGARDSLSSYVDIAMVQSIASRMPEFIRDYGMVIVDECHHIAADSFLKVMNAVRPKYVYGLSATVKRLDGLECLIHSQCGPVVFQYGANKLAYERGLAQTFVPRFTNSMLSVFEAKPFNNVVAIKELSIDDARNRLIVDDVVALKDSGKRILILTKLVEHTRILEAKLNERGISSIVLTGEMKAVDRKKVNEILESNIDGAFVVISTGQYLGEGIDIPYLDTLMVVSPIGWEGVVSQYAGRISREFVSKDKVCIYDYVDICVPQYARMYAKRLSSYRKLGYVLGSEMLSRSNGDVGGLLREKCFYSQYDVFDLLVFLMRNASKSIVVSSPEVFLSRESLKLIDELLVAIERGVSVEIRTSSLVKAVNSDAQLESLRYLKERNIFVFEQDRCYLRFGVFDGLDVLFGDLNLLGGSIKESPKGSFDLKEPKIVIHMENAKIAETLLGSNDILSGLMFP